ncbi:hypothetical protein TSL6_01010 [Sulfurovum sp. TSL6]|uniref:hypothetical protein n=1 Tax=Sulfurovum sp. TSL6 TaxID=2826995 RepID=UPI001CC493AF|nr:hypothetical protein [Sulfurovum sp. TSL6]GIT99594.1 hypothetical protein TSL6_01010 [Sulfurovum sp. TSL6]
MNNNANVSEEIIRNAEDKSSETIDEMIEEIENEASEDLEKIDDATLKMREETIEPFEDETLEMTEGPVPDPILPGKAKKNVKTMHLVEKTKKMLKEVNDREEACKHLLEKDIKEYEDARSSLKENGLDACTSLVKKLGYQTRNDELEEKDTVVCTPKKELKPLVLKDISRGRFSGLVFALLGGIATAIGLVYLATEKLNMTLNVTRVPSEDETQSILAWFSTLLGLHEDVTIGAGVLGFLVILVMILIYVARVSLKTSSNLHIAVKQFVETEFYIAQKANCHAETDKIDMHIKDTIGIMRTYEVLFTEQKGKLERILYVEGEREKSTDYHDKSYTEIRETKELIRAIREYMNIPMVEEGKLSSKSVLLLQHAKDQADKMIKRFYYK